MASMKDRDFQQGFLTVFTRVELQEIQEKSCLRAHDCFVIFNRNYFFVLSIEEGRGLDIYCGYNDNYEKEANFLDKYSFLEGHRVEVKAFEVS